MDPNHYDASKQIAGTPSQQAVTRNEPSTSYNPAPKAAPATGGNAAFNSVGRC